MTIREQIIGFMTSKYVTEQTAMMATPIAAAINMHVADVTAELSVMCSCDPPILCRRKAEVKGFVTTVYWPATVTVSAKKEQETATVAKPIEISALLTEKQEPTTMTTETKIIESDPIQLRLLTFLKNNPYCSGADAEKGADVSANCFLVHLKWYLDNGYISRTREGGSVTNALSDKAKDMTPKQLYDLKKTDDLNKRLERKKNKHETASESETKAVTNEITNNIEAINEVAALKIKQPAVEAIKKNRAITAITEPITFKVAYTSDGTLILWGVHSDPIELDFKQTETLTNFIDEVRLS